MVDNIMEVVASPKLSKTTNAPLNDHSLKIEAGLLILFILFFIADQNVSINVKI